VQKYDTIAEGAGEYAVEEKAWFYRMTKRSATECAGILDVCHRLQLTRISHTFSDSSHTLHDDLAVQMGEAVLLEHCPHPSEQQSQSAERRSV
jgi:hypothetical protein